MRKLMWFAVGFAAACAAGVYLQMNMLCLVLGSLCILGFLGSLFFASKSAKIAAAVFLGVVIGFAWVCGFHGFYLSAARSHDGETLPVTITATDYSYTPNYGQAFDGSVELDGKRYQVRCYLNEAYEITPGQIVTGQFRLRFTGDGGEREATHHQGKGIFLLATQKSDVQITNGPIRLPDYPALWRQKITRRLIQIFPSDGAGFARALLLGDTEGLTYQQNRAFQVSGLRHVVAVSGLHVSILFALIYMAFGHRRVLNALFGLPLLLIFAAIAGFTPSIVRACLMQLLMLLSMLVDKEYDPPTALAFAVLVILGVNPMAVTAVGFQLSVGCMIGIFAFSEKLQQYFLSFGKLKEKSKGKARKAKFIRWLTGSVAVTLSAMVVTTPLCALYFGMVSLVGILSNLLTLWIITFVFYGIMIAVAAAIVWLPLGQGIAWLVNWLIRYVLAISGLMAKFPLAAVYTDSIYIILWLILSYTLLAVFFLTKKKYPGVTAAGIMILLTVCIGLSWLEPKLDDLRVSVIDVGQGQCILVIQDGVHYLVDCGGESPGVTADTVANHLMSQGIFGLDGVILTHYDKDHACSVVELLSVMDVDRIYMPDVSDSNGIREKLFLVYPEKIHLISETEQLHTDSGKVTLFPGNSGADDNENGLCVLFQRENCDILITGDRSGSGERALIKQTQLPKLELLIAGHHGSNASTSLELLLQTMPDAVAISVSENNPYGHPQQEMLDRVTRFGCEIYRTDRQGTIIFRR